MSFEKRGRKGKNDMRYRRYRRYRDIEIWRYGDIEELILRVIFKVFHKSGRFFEKEGKDY